MKVLSLGEAVSATVDAAQTAVQPTATPFLTGRDVVAEIIPNGVTGTPTVLIEGSDDGTTYTTLLSSTVLTPKRAVIKVKPYMRLNVTEVGTAGSYNAYLTNGA